jgi:hypothetical protein
MQCIQNLDTGEPFLLVEKALGVQSFTSVLQGTVAKTTHATTIELARWIPNAFENCLSGVLNVSMAISVFVELLIFLTVGSYTFFAGLWFMSSWMGLNVFRM